MAKTYAPRRSSSKVLFNGELIARVLQKKGKNMAVFIGGAYHNVERTKKYSRVWQVVS